MTEMLFVLTVIFVAYVVYVAVNEHKTTSKSTSPKTKPEAPEEVSEQPKPVAPKMVAEQPKPVAPKMVAEQPKPEAAVKISKPATIKPATIKKPIATATTTQDSGKKGLRDPKTGEVATMYSNYRFTKRWIKDALVTEGLLEKVYKNNELDAAIEATIKDAIAKLEAIEKYKP